MNLVESILEPSKLRRVMSRDARELMETLVVDAHNWYNSIRHTDAQAGQHFIDEINARIDPIHYEIAIMYANSQSIMRAISNRTAKAYDKASPLKDIKSGTLRKTDIDYIQVALAAPEYWHKLVRIPRTNPLPPEKIRNNFTFHKLYKDVTGWLAVDCTYSDIYFLWDASHDSLGMQVIQQIINKPTELQYANCGILRHKYKDQYQIEQRRQHDDATGIAKSKKLYDEVQLKLAETPATKEELAERVKQFRDELNTVLDFANIPITTVAADGTILMAKSNIPNAEPTWKFGTNNMSERKMREMLKPDKSDKK